jgi:Flp pilus assembly pilin Flp
MFWSSSKGQGLVEYGLILVLAAVVIIATLWLLEPNVGNILASFMAD